jgi:hypothetical protein
MPMFYISSAAALLVSGLAGFFYVISGAGFAPSLLCVAAVILLLAGLLPEKSYARLGCKLSSLGAGASMLAVLYGVSQVVRPALTQQGQMFLLVVPGIFLAVLSLHLMAARNRWTEIASAGLMSDLKKVSTK